MNLVCGDVERNFHKECLSLSAGEEKTYSSKLPINSYLFGDVSGKCKIVASFNDELTETTSFEVSKAIKIDFSIENAVVEPGRSFVLKGKAIKEDGKEVAGFIDISIDSLNLNLTRPVNNGVFEINVSVPVDAKSGSHSIMASVYEQDNKGEVTNQGRLSSSIRVNARASRLEISLEKQEFLPGEELKFKPLILDQGEDVFPGDVLVEIYKSEKRLFKEVLKSGQEKATPLEKSISPGYWEIKAVFSNLEISRPIYILEAEKASFEINNLSLVITNEGNVPYRKAVQVLIGDKQEIIKTAIGVGEKKEYFLSAPNGEYSVKVLDGVNELEKRVFLTGNAIKVSEYKEKGSIFSSFPLVWIFLILVFGAFAILTFQRVRSKKALGYAVEDKKDIAKGTKENSIKSQDNLVGFQLKTAEQSLVLNGNKEEAGVAALRIADLKQKKDNANETIERIRSIIELNKGILYESDNFILALFSPSSTKSFKNQLTAAKVARDIKNLIDEHNKKFKEKLEYGVSIHSGNLIIKKDRETFKFTPLGNTISLPKKLAALAKGEVFLSEEVYKQMMAEVKVEKQALEGINAYKLTRLSEKEGNERFISDFLRRQKSS